MQMNFHRKLLIPQEVKKEYPLTETRGRSVLSRSVLLRTSFTAAIRTGILSAWSRDL